MAEMTLRFNCEALAGVNQPREGYQRDGDYYYVLLGALNVYNSENIFYMYNESKHVFENSNVFMRKVRAGNLWGELDHPPLLPGMSEAAFIERNEWIEITNTAFHIRDVVVKVTDETCDGEPVVEIWGWISPEGAAHGARLKAALDNPDMNVCFSLRAIVREGVIRGRKCRRIDKLCTFDYVIEDGLKICNKYSAMIRGSKVAQESSRTFVNRAISSQALERICNDPSAVSSVARESSRAQVREYAKEYLGYMGRTHNLAVKGLGQERW